MNVEFLPAAQQELIEARAFYDGRVAGLGEDLLIEAEAMCDRLSHQPNLGTRLDSIHRRLPLRRFPFALVFRVDASAIRIVAFAHNRRRPGYWRPEGR